ncbi:unnamed protein product [Bemisia tabaci]|uniref:Uncharacterized protein n=1 Tax=Bemisia tabaci TaxID=7038 RepID=A0A9P0AAS8_BEMTA|nr:unnamed protein product [Bemisia tabaci]
MRFVISVHGFKSNTNRYIVKECSLITLDGEALYHWIVKSPFQLSELDHSRRREASHVTHRVHGLSWDDGDIEYGDWVNSLKTLADRAETIYAKGKEIALFLSTLLGVAVTNVEDLGCPALKNLTGPALECLHHRLAQSSVTNCALVNASLVRHWLFNYEHPADSGSSANSSDFDESLRSRSATKHNSRSMWYCSKFGSRK